MRFATHGFVSRRVTFMSEITKEGGGQTVERTTEKEQTSQRTKLGNSRLMNSNEWEGALFIDLDHICWIGIWQVQFEFEWVSAVCLHTLYDTCIIDYGQTSKTDQNWKFLVSTFCESMFASWFLLTLVIAHSCQNNSINNQPSTTNYLTHTPAVFNCQTTIKL